ncbi:MAG TPA: hypothetical protein PK863_00360 [Candidatus Dojkabacteria bacterium]|nr:hypothetical protein [Candidatus Dojkabacteria bacterium]
MHNLLENIKILLNSVSIFGLISSVFKFIFTTVLLLVYVTLITIFIVQYEFVLIISRISTLLINILNSIPFFS